MRKAFKAVYDALSAISLANWLWGLPYAGGSAVLGGAWASISGLPAPVSVLIGLAFGVLTYIAYVAIYQHRHPIHVHHDRHNEPLQEAVVAGDNYKADITPAAPKKLTEVDRERCARAFQELHDFVNEDLKRLYLGISPGANKANSLTPSWASPEDALAEQSRMHIELSNLLQRHWHYFDMVNLDVGPTLRSLERLTGLLNAVAQAKDWPPEAKVDRLSAVADTVGEMWSNAMALMHSMRAKREEYGI